MEGQIVGFDIGEKQLKMALFSGKTLRKTAVVELPDNLVRDGEIVSMDAMADFIRQSTKENGIPRCGASIVLPGSLVISRNVTVPYMNVKQLEYNLPFEFNDYLSQEKAKYYFDYAVNEKIADEDGNIEEIELFSCAVLKETIERYRSMFRRAGFRLRSAVPEEYAYGVLVRENGELLPGGEGVTCILDIGHRGMRMIILQNKKIETTRTIERGLVDLEQMIADKYDADIHRAHVYLNQNYDDVQICDEAIEIYQQMAMEIMKTINFYRYSNRDRELENMYSCGGGSRVDALVNVIELMTDVKVKSVSAICAQTQDREAASICAKAIGTGLAV